MVLVPQGDGHCWSHHQDGWWTMQTGFHSSWLTVSRRFALATWHLPHAWVRGKFQRTAFPMSQSFMNLHIIPYKRLGHADTNSQLLILYFSMGREGFPGGTSGKEPTCQYRSHKGRQFDLWVRKIPWRRAWQPTPVVSPGESHGWRSLAG